MAGAGYKVFATGDVLSASDVNTYMMQQTVMVFANASARTSALSAVLAEGMVSYLQDTNSLEVYDGSAWVGATGDITGLTAGTGVAITSATGPVPTVAIDTAVVPQLGAANTFTTSPQQINGAASAVGLIVRANATTPGDLQQWQSSGAAIVAVVTVSGGMALANRLSVGYNSIQTTAITTISTISAGNIGIAVRGSASQTAKLQEWQNSAGTTLNAIGTNGEMQGQYFGALAGGKAFIQTNLDTNGLAVVTGAAANKGFIIRGAASQTANLFEAQDSSGTTLILISASGDLFTPGGSARSARFRYFDGTNASGTYIDTQIVTNSMTMAARSTTAVTVIVRAAASQTAAMHQWQTSAGTVVAQLTATGNMSATQFGTLNNYVFGKEESGGGQVRLARSTAAPTQNRASNYAQLYLRAGTNAGTLKLVIIAGTTGTETTILDNISQ